MKRTILLFSVVVVAAITFAGLSGKVEANKTGTCCQVFEIVSTTTPPSGCVITIRDTQLQCTVDPSTMQCKICNIPEGEYFTADVECDGERRGSAQFTCNAQDVVYINVP